MTRHRRQTLMVIMPIVVVASLTAIAHPATAATGKDKLASAIENRLNALGDPTSVMTASAGYFYRNPILPVYAFQTSAGCGRRFVFSVNVYKTKAQAVTMYDYFYQHVLSIGGNFSAFNMVRRGRVIYTAETASIYTPGTAAGPNQHAPAVPTKQFHSLAAEVNAPLPSHPRGCRPDL